MNSRSADSPITQKTLEDETRNQLAETSASVEYDFNKYLKSLTEHSSKAVQDEILDRNSKLIKLCRCVKKAKELKELFNQATK